MNFNEVTEAASQIAGWSLTSGNAATHAVIWDASLNIKELRAHDSGEDGLLVLWCGSFIRNS